MSRPLDGLECNLCGSRRKCPFDLERVDKQREVLSILLECVKTASGLECKSTSDVHVDLEEIETERNIVHVHEDLMIKSTVRV